MSADKPAAKEPVALSVTERTINGTLYVVKSFQSEYATETAAEKLTRIILSHIVGMGNS